MNYRVSFPDHPQFAAVELEEGANLSEHLSADNSPVLFGCRTGICGTCLIEVIDETNGALHKRTDDELDLLPLLAPENPHARLACQIRLNADIAIRPLEPE